MNDCDIVLPQDIQDQMMKFSSINWNAVVRDAVVKKLSALEFFENIASKSKLTEKDALELGKKVNEGMWQKHKNYVR